MGDRRDLFPLVEVMRNGIVESSHLGCAVIIDFKGTVIEEWGDSKRIIFPRSSIKMIQALPLIESGALKNFGLGGTEVALACASHQGSIYHTSAIEKWLSIIGIDEKDLRCGIQPPSAASDRKVLRDLGKDFSQLNNNCSGKHAGFLTVSKFLNYDPDYIDVDHPLQKEIRSLLSELSGEEIDKFGMDGCSAPNFMCSVKGLALAMAKFSAPSRVGITRINAMNFVMESMYANPYLVAGRNRACTELMEASKKPIIVKTGAEGVFLASVPDKKIGVALKILDGSTRASEAAITTILVRLGVLNRQHPLVKKRLLRIIRNWNDYQTGVVTPSERFWAKGARIG